MVLAIGLDRYRYRAQSRQTGRQTDRQTEKVDQYTGKMRVRVVRVRVVRWRQT